MWPKFGYVKKHPNKYMMRLLHLVEKQFTTKHGQQIRLERHADTEGDDNRGWQVDEVRAFVGDIQVGYLKMSYIPLERYKRYYPSIFNYLDQVGGWSGLMGDFKNRAADWHTFDDDRLKKLIKNVEWRGFHNDYSRKPEELDHDHKTLVQWAARLEAQLLAGRYGEQFKQFRKSHVNKPLVDYIRVAKGGRDDAVTRRDQDKLGGPNSSINYRKKGIGRAMYLEGAQWLKEQGMVLRASSLQQPEAAAAWMSFKRDGLTRKDKDGRTYLSV